jgi:hypothetical protein
MSMEIYPVVYRISDMREICIHCNVQGDAFKTGYKPPLVSLLLQKL